MNRPTKLAVLLCAVAYLASMQPKSAMISGSGTTTEQKVIPHSLTYQLKFPTSEIKECAFKPVANSAPVSVKPVEVAPKQDNSETLRETAIKVLESDYSVKESRAEHIVDAALEDINTLKSKYGLTVELHEILGIIAEESDFQPYEVSSEDAMGLMQVTPATWSQQCSELQISPPSEFNIKFNILVGAHLYASMKAKHGDIGAIVSYSVGESNLQRQIDRELAHSGSYYYRISKSMNNFESRGIK